MNTQVVFRNREREYTHILHADSYWLCGQGHRVVHSNDVILMRLLTQSVEINTKHQVGHNMDVVLMHLLTQTVHINTRHQGGHNIHVVLVRLLTQME